MEEANRVRLQMNEAGTRGEPFLFAVDFEQQRGLFYRFPLEQKTVLFDVRGVSNAGDGMSPATEPLLLQEPIAYEEYARRFELVKRGLMRGDSFLLNLTAQTPVHTAWSLKDIFYGSHALYRLYVPGEFVCFSPERFVLIENGVISSNPMKGTIDASVPRAEQVILSDYKERSEHNTIVDLIRNDLNRVADRVSVKRFRYMDRLRTTNGDILQVSSEVVGYLPDGYESRLGDVVFELLPAGSISGAPKLSTLDIISQAEGEPRGFYTGVFGYFDGQRLDSAVMIRFIEERGCGHYFRSGGGITVNSNCRDEYEEAIRKVYLAIS